MAGRGNMSPDPITVTIISFFKDREFKRTVYPVLLLYNVGGVGCMK